MRSRYLLIFLLSVFISSCSIFGGGENVDDLIDTFSVGEQGTQYYINRLEFEDKDGNESTIDFTFRYKDQIKDSCITNISIWVEDLMKDPESVTFKNSNVNYTHSQLDLMFAEKDDDDFHSRFTMNIPMTTINDLFKDNNWTITFKKGNRNLTYTPTSSAKEKISILNNDLFVIFR